MKETENILKSLINSYNLNQKPNYFDLVALENIVKINNPNFKHIPIDGEPKLNNTRISKKTFEQNLELYKDFI